MVRPREFDRDEVLDRASGIFWQKGFTPTSTEDLLSAMNIRRQSLYNTFGDKRLLYLEALERYCAWSVAGHIKILNEAASPLAGIQGVLLGLIQDDKAARGRGCMGVNSVCEFGDADPEVAKIRAKSGALLQKRLVSAIREGQASGEIDPTMEAAEAAAFVQMTLTGIQVGARAGAGVAALRSLALFAVDRLKARA